MKFEVLCDAARSFRRANVTVTLKSLHDFVRGSVPDLEESRSRSLDSPTARSWERDDERRPLPVLILGFVRFCGRKADCLVGCTGASRPHLLLAAHEIVAQVLGKPRLFQVRLGRILLLLPARLAFGLLVFRRLRAFRAVIVVYLHGSQLAQNQHLRKPQGFFSQVFTKNFEMLLALPVQLWQ